ncbi:hypothetical protein ONZ45_g9505 [Pleurotus djamor]|nr:hypothetical protein ONZ45_g9505 [Pleurotus djamor]
MDAVLQSPDPSPFRQDICIPDTRHSTFIRPPSLEEFEALWCSGVPLSLRSHQPSLSLWNTAELITLFEGRSCIIEDCCTGLTRESNVEEFLSMLFTSRVSSPLKLKDYPPDATFSSVFPALARDFQHALPYPSVTSNEGALNLVNLFPANYASAPDLGPKAYIATGSSAASCGTTRLHTDWCDAANVMLPAHPDSSATWHIFLPSDYDKLRQFLNQIHDLSEAHDLIHEQGEYLTVENLKDLEAIGVHPFIFQQRVGDAILVPAGAAHQVILSSSSTSLAEL